MHVNNTIECSPFQQGLKRLLKQDLLLQNLGNHDEVFPKSKKAKQAIKKALG